MKNRWDMDLCRGMRVRYYLPPGGHGEGVIVGFERISGYGWRCKLEGGMTCSIDDVIKTEKVLKGST